MIEPIYLIPGWGFQGSIFSDVVLKERHVIALDYFHLMDVSIESIARHLAQAIVKPAVIIAWSLGGIFAIKIASLFPDKIKKLVLLSSQPRLTAEGDYSGIDPKAIEAFIETRSFKVLRNRFISLVGFPNRNVASKLNHYFIEGVEENLMALLKLMLIVDLRSEYSKIKIKILHIIASKDAVLKQRAQCLLALNPDVKVISIENAGHSGFLAQANLYHLIINRFISGSYE